LTKNGPCFFFTHTYIPPPPPQLRQFPRQTRHPPTQNTPIHSSPMSPPGWVLPLPIAAPKNPALTRIGAAANPIRTAHPIGADKPAWSVKTSATSARIVSTPACACPARNIER